MARFDFGGTLADFVVTSRRLGGLDVLGLSSATLTFWSAQSGGTQYSDLQLNGSSVSSITVGADGQVPTFQGPDSVTVMWVDGGSGRVRIAAQGIPGPAGPGATNTDIAGYVATGPTQTALDAAYGSTIYAEGSKYANVQAALNAAQSGDTVLVTRSHTISAPYTVPVSGITIQHAPGVTITQTTWAKPVYDCFNVDRIKILGRPRLVFSGTRGDAAVPGAFRGEGGYEYGAGIWSNGSDNEFEAECVGFTSGVKLTSWNGSALVSNGRKNNKVDLVVSNVDFGINYLGQTDLRVDMVANSIGFTVNGGPPHAVYGTGNSTIRSSRITWGSVVCNNNPYSYAFQAKYCDGLTIGTMQATNCPSLYNNIDTTGVSIGEGIALGCTNDTTGVGQVLVDFQRIDTTKNDTITIGRLILDRATCTSAQFKQALGLVGSNVQIGSLLLSDDISNAASGLSSIILSGSKITVESLQVYSKTFEHLLILIGTGAVSDAVTVRKIKANKNREICQVEATATGVVLDYNPAELGTHTALFPTVRAIDGTAIGYTVARTPYERSYTQAGGTVPTTNKPDPFTETRTHYVITAATATTITAPQTGAYVGMLHEVSIENGTAGALGTVTWAAGYTLNGTYAPPAAGMVTMTRFRWNGTAWVQVV